MSVKLLPWTSKDGKTSGHSIVEGSDKGCDALIAKCREAHKAGLEARAELANYIAKDAGLKPDTLTVGFTKFGKANVSAKADKAARSTKQTVDTKSVFAIAA